MTAGAEMWASRPTLSTELSRRIVDAAAAMTLLVSRDAHQSVVAGLIFSGVQPRWIPSRWDADLHLTHAPSPAAVEDAWISIPTPSARWS